MLTDEERQEIEAEFANYESKRALSVDALKVVQKRRGWVDDEALAEVAALLEMSPAELDNVATFYNLIYREPVGLHVIHVCDSISCWVMGCERLTECLSAKLGVKMGETTADKRFTLLPVVCLGACDKAPALIVNDDLHGTVDPDNLDDLLNQYD
jgi:NADH-quinone oxidoreductase subunit E